MPVFATVWISPFEILDEPFQVTGGGQEAHLSRQESQLDEKGRSPASERGQSR